MPAALRGTPAGQIFSQMVRFTDGPVHCPLKAAVSRALATVTATQAAAQSTAWARTLAHEIEPTRDSARLSRYAYHLPVYVAASLLGVPSDLLPQTTTWAADFARCLAPGSTPDQVARGSAAAAHARPGAPLATTIASAALTQLLTSGADPQHLALPPTYRPSQNLRIALAPSQGSA